MFFGNAFQSLLRYPNWPKVLSLLIVCELIPLKQGMCWFNRRHLIFALTHGGNWTELGILCLLRGFHFVHHFLDEVNLVIRTCHIEGSGRFGRLSFYSSIWDIISAYFIRTWCLLLRCLNVRGSILKELPSQLLVARLNVQLCLLLKLPLFLFLNLSFLQPDFFLHLSDLRINYGLSLLLDPFRQFHCHF